MTLLTRKGLTELQDDAGSGSLRRVLGARDLITLGIGAIIGSGVYVLTGPIASHYAGPAIVISIALAGLACAFAGLCYAEFASMIPAAGSAYTYAYATLGEIFAWIIGWDLILEYTLGAALTAVGWSSYIVSFLHGIGIDVPARYTMAFGQTAVLATGEVVHGTGNVIAAAGVIAVTLLLIIGIRESVAANATIVLVKLGVLLLFIGFGAVYVHPHNWSPFIPDNTGEFGHFGWSGIVRGAAVGFFAFIGFDAVSTAAQESKNPQRDMPIGILGSLAICTVLYVLVALVLTGLVPYTQLDVADPMSVGIDATGTAMAAPVRQAGRGRGIVECDARAAVRAAARPVRNEPRRSAARRIRARPSKIRNAVHSEHGSHGVRRRHRRGARADPRARRNRIDRDAARIRDRVRGCARAALQGARAAAALSHARRTGGAAARRAGRRLPHGGAAAHHVVAAAHLVCCRDRRVFRVWTAGGIAARDARVIGSSV